MGWLNLTSDTIVFCTCVSIFDRDWSRMGPDRNYRMLSRLSSNPSVEAWLLQLILIPALPQVDTSPSVSVLIHSPTEIVAHSHKGGIVFQFAAVVVYMLLTTEFLVRFALKKPFAGREETLNGARMIVLDSKTKQMIAGVGLSSLAMFIR